MTGVEVSAVIPVFNDREALKTTIPLSIARLGEIAPEFELIIAEDGSTDKSADLIRSWEKQDPRVRLLHSDERLGRGRALNRAFSAAEGAIVCYYDVDLATDMNHLGTLIGAIRNGYDIATGSRLLPESRIERSGGREIASRGYNLLVRTILGSRIHDHQCGFKAFSRQKILSIIPAVRDTHWFWDTEVLVRAGRKRFKICEFPVTWQQGGKTTVKRHDVWDMGTAIVRLWWTLHAEKD